MTEQLSKKIMLDTPIMRGSKEISEIMVRKPKAGELRGVSLASLMQMDVNELTKVMPRITNPTLTIEDINEMDPADLTQVAIEVAYFLAPKSVTTAYLTA